MFKESWDFQELSKYFSRKVRNTCKGLGFFQWNSSIFLVLGGINPEEVTEKL